MLSGHEHLLVLEDLGLVPRTHMVIQTIHDSTSRALNAFFFLTGTKHAWYKSIHADQILTHRLYRENLINVFN